MPIAFECENQPLLLFDHITGAGEMSVFLAALFGSLSVSFGTILPGDVFMGGHGSLAIGGALATAAVLINRNCCLSSPASSFCAEFVSSLIQDRFGVNRGGFGLRIFSARPLHDAFRRGMAEQSRRSPMDHAGIAAVIS